MGKRRILKTVISAALAAALFSALAVDTLAWLKTSVEGKFNLGADSTPEVSLYVGAYDGSVYRWGEPVKVNANHLGESFGTTFTGCVTSGDFDRESRFGEINDLTELHNSNYLWMCLKIHEEEGLYFRNLRVQYGETPFLFYGTDWEFGEPQDKPRLHHEADQAIEKHLDQLMVVAPGRDLFISDQGPEAGGLEPRDTDPARQRFVQRHGTAGSGEDLHGSASAVDREGYYYIYFRVSPNLDQYSSMVSEETVLNYMPCYLSFQDLRVLVDVSTTDRYAEENQK